MSHLVFSWVSLEESVNIVIEQNLVIWVLSPFKQSWKLKKDAVTVYSFLLLYLVWFSEEVEEWSIIIPTKDYMITIGMSSFFSKRTAPW